MPVSYIVFKAKQQTLKHNNTIYCRWLNIDGYEYRRFFESSVRIRNTFLVPF